MKSKAPLFIVDDDLFSLNVYQERLKNAGYHALEVFENGTDCLNHLPKKPWAIFLDHNMHDISGFEVLKKIKRNDPNIHVIVVSAQEDMKTAIDALKYGAFDYIIKTGEETTNMINALKRIEHLQEELKRLKPSLLQRILSIF